MKCVVCFKTVKAISGRIRDPFCDKHFPNKHRLIPLILFTKKLDESFNLVLGNWIELESTLNTWIKLDPRKILFVKGRRNAEKVRRRMFNFLSSVYAFVEMIKFGSRKIGYTPKYLNGLVGAQEHKISMRLRGISTHVNLLDLKYGIEKPVNFWFKPPKVSNPKNTLRLPVEKIINYQSMIGPKWVWKRDEMKFLRAQGHSWDMLKFLPHYYNRVKTMYNKTKDELNNLVKMV